MAGLILYTVNPRTLGVTSQWAAALREAQQLYCNGIRLMPFHPVTAIAGAGGMTGNLYAAADHFTIAEEFCPENSYGADQAAAWYHLRDFIRMAGAGKIRVMADLVLHGLAADHPAAARHPQFFRFTEGAEVATIDYTNADAWNYFLGDSGYWLRMMDQYLDAGFSAFYCCNVAAVPQLVWEQVVNYARRRRADVIVVAETQGISEGDVELMLETLREDDARIIYDLHDDNAAPGWDMKDASYLTQARKPLKKASHHGTMGAVDRDGTQRAAELRKLYEDTRDTVADAKIAMTCLRDYAVACFSNNSVMLPRGFQWGMKGNSGLYREEVSMDAFQQMKADRKENPSPLSIGGAIAEMHELRAKIPRDARPQVHNIMTTDSAFLTAVQCDFHDDATDRVLASIVLLLNTAPERGPEKFPENWYQKLKEEQVNAQRIQFGPDRKYQNGISGVAIVIVPGDYMAKMALNQKNAAAPKPGEELKLTA